MSKENLLASPRQRPEKSGNVLYVAHRFDQHWIDHDTGRMGGIRPVLSTMPPQSAAASTEHESALDVVEREIARASGVDVSSPCPTKQKWQEQLATKKNSPSCCSIL